MKVRLAYLLMILVFASFVSDKPAYKIYNAKGEASDYDKMIADALKADVILIGEYHDNAICHWMELEVTIDAFKARGKEVVLGAEMYESDTQGMVDDYLSGKIKYDSLAKSKRLWNNDPTDYKPLLDFAKENKLRFISTNVVRKYASIVNKKGFEGLDSLSEDEKKFFAPLPIKYDPNVKCYKDIADKMGDMPGMGKMKENIPKAQALKDATMAYNINKNFKPGNLFVHYQGAFHSDYHVAIMWYLQQYNPKLKIVTISCATQDDINKLNEDSYDKADYIICIPNTMTKTY